MSVLSKILNKFDTSNQVISCKYITDSLYFDAHNRVRLCPYENVGIITENFDGLWLDINKINSVKSSLYDNYKNGQIPDKCQNCFNLKKNNEVLHNELKYLYLSNWQQCYINCSYCDCPKFDDLIQAGHYDIFPIIKQLIDEKIVTKKTKVIFECGDPCIHPEFDKILFYFINYEMLDITINTPALRYCDSVAQAIGKNIAEVVISLDSGCPYIYEKIKGTNKFDIVTANLKRYLEHQEPNQKRVALKYTVLNGVNDNQKEILDWFILSRDFGVKKLVFDVERKWYNQIKNSVPYYLIELVLFAKNMSVYNNLEIEFSENAEAIYGMISKEEK